MCNGSGAGIGFGDNGFRLWGLGFRAARGDRGPISIMSSSPIIHVLESRFSAVANTPLPHGAPVVCRSFVFLCESGLGHLSFGSVCLND
jgi:hypothetical protein